MLLAERCAPGDQAISREPAAPLFIVVTAKQVFDAVEQRHRQATVREAPEAAAAKLRQPPPSLSRLSNVSKRHEVSQLGHTLNHAHGGKGVKWLPTASTAATRAMSELRREPIIIIRSSAWARRAQGRSSWGGAGGVLGRRGAVTVALRCGSCDRASFEVGDGACGIEFPRSLFPRL